MNFVGIDIGSLSTKAVILSSGKIECGVIIRTKPDSVASAQEVTDKLMEKSGLLLRDIDYIVATGYGRIHVPFANKHITEISCHAKGTHWLFPDAGTVLDMGGQDCKAIKFDTRGAVVDFLLNERCAAGTGRFLERTAATLGIPLEQLGPRSLEVVEGAAEISSTCTVFAQRDILQLLQQGRHPNDIIAGACDALVRRISGMVEKVGIERELSISGGVAKNIGIVNRLEDHFERKVRIFDEPQVVGAIGAALFGHKAATGQEPAWDEEATMAQYLAVGQ